MHGVSKKGLDRAKGLLESLDIPIAVSQRTLVEAFDTGEGVHVPRGWGELGVIHRRECNRAKLRMRNEE